MPASSLRGEAGHLVDEAGELALAEHDELHVGLGDDRRVAGRLLEQGELAERVAGADGGDLAALAGDPGLPSRITKNSWPVSPSETSVLPAGTRTSSARRATSWRSLREQAANSGTCWRWSMNASRRAMGGKTYPPAHPEPHATIQTPQEIGPFGESDNTLSSYTASIHSSSLP